MTYAEAIGLAYDDSGEHDVDLVVVGAGPAGLAAAGVYGASEGLVTVVLDCPGDRGRAGGDKLRGSRTTWGLPSGISGEELTRLALVQALKFGAQLYAPCDVMALDATDPAGPVLSAGRRHASASPGGDHRHRRPLPPSPGATSGGSSSSSGAGSLLGHGPRGARDCVTQPRDGGRRRELSGTGGSLPGVTRVAGSTWWSVATASGRACPRTWPGGSEAHPMVTVRTNARLLKLCGEEDLEAVVIGADGGAPFVRECRGLFCFIGAEPDIAHGRRDP